MSARLRGRVAAVVLLMLAGAACDAQGSSDTSYVFNPAQGSVKLDTPELRALKAAAHIAPCPATAAIADTEDAEGRGLPALTLPCLGGGRAVDLAGLRGPLVVNFWAQTCGPCRDEAPLLQDLWSRSGSKVQVVGVDYYDPRPGLALEFAKVHGLTYPQVADPEAAAKGDLKVSALPMTFFVDETGQITYTQVGPIADAQELSDLLREHLGVDVPATSP